MTALSVQRNQVIEIQNLAPGHRIHASETSRRYNDTIGFNKHYLVSVLALEFPASNELELCQMRPQFRKDRPATADVLIIQCLTDFW
jgi:hypothetical protein